MHIITMVIFVESTDTRTIIACQSGRLKNTHTLHASEISKTWMKYALQTTQRAPAENLTFTLKQHSDSSAATATSQG